MSHLTRPGQKIAEHLALIGLLLSFEPLPFISIGVVARLRQVLL